MENELKPCPFCGKQPTIEMCWKNLCRIICDDADHTASICWCDSKQEAIEFWNRRCTDGT